MFRVAAPAIADALGAIVAAALPAGVPCSVGYPAAGLQPEQVWISLDFSAELPRRISGGGQRDEAGAVEIRIAVTQTTNAVAEPRTRAEALAGYVEDAIAAAPTLAGAAIEAHVARISGQEAIPDERQRAYGLALTVAYLATVTR